MKRWECTVCGYIHTGEEPPETCPVCGADKSKFVELPPEESVLSKPSATRAEAVQTSEISAGTESPSGLYGLVSSMMTRHHAHPISVHIPNGVVPLSVTFIILASIFNFFELTQAAFYNLIFVLLVMPLVLFSGYNDWKRKYGGNKTTLFITKMICAAVVALTAFLIVIWHVINPEVAMAGSPHRFLFILLNLVMLFAAGIAGFLGGKLVFRD